MPRPGHQVRACIVAMAIAAAAAGTATAQQSPAPMMRQTLDAGPYALCNDGSAPVFYFRPGSGSDSEKWIIYFQGGGGCTDEVSCQARAVEKKNLTTASRMPATMNHEGLLSPLPSVNPDFHSYAHVYVHYCSSDFWAGAAERRIGDATWYFSGRAIVDAVIERLSTQSIGGAPTLATATEVLVSGSSAGAIGAHNNLDRVAAMLPDARVRGLFDSGWIPNIEPFGPGIFPVLPYGAEALAFYNAAPDESCTEANPDEAGMCLNEEFVFPYIETPAYVFADQRDPTLLSALGIVGPPENDEERQYVRRFAIAVRDGLESVPAYFAVARTRHTILLTPAFATVAADGVTFVEAFADWYFDRPGKRQIVGTPGR